MIVCYALPTAQTNISRTIHPSIHRLLISHVVQTLTHVLGVPPSGNFACRWRQRWEDLWSPVAGPSLTGRNLRIDVISGPRQHRQQLRLITAGTEPYLCFSALPSLEFLSSLLHAESIR